MGTFGTAATTPAPTLDDLLLLRLALATPPDTGLPGSRVAADLAPLLAGAGDTGTSAWRERFAGAVERRTAAGEISIPKRGRLVLTAAGRAAAGARFGEAAVTAPGAGGSWVGVRDGLLVALALGGAPADPGAITATRSADTLRAVILLQHHAPDARLDRPTTLREVVNLLATRAVRARRGTPAELRAAVLRGWLATDVAPLPEPAVAGPLADPLAVFASAVREAARRCPEMAWMGEHKVFVGPVYDEWNRRAGDGKDLTAFKQWLALANERGLLRLSRADLAGTHPPAMFAASEVRSLGATFHLVRLD